jgi:transcriptional regulator with GAF, ATPase, and Fis domain
VDGDGPVDEEPAQFPVQGGQGFIDVQRIAKRAEKVEQRPHVVLIGRNRPCLADKSTRMLCHQQPCFLGVKAVIASAAMRQLMETVARIARTSAAVLITGETGSGKEIVARAIHHYSVRASRP